MKINEVEKRLGITKANIRFYEKEGLLTPGRTENGYRDYGEGDITRLKQIVILRKLGIPVQQIADILDGALPLQEALDENIAALNEEIEKLNGSLALCRQLQNEDAQSLDTERYWGIIHDQEQLGARFQSLASDYINFLGHTLLLPSYWIPEGQWHNPKGILKYIAGWSLALAALYSLTGKSFLGTFASGVSGRVLGILIWGILLLPLYFLGRKNPRVRAFLEKWMDVFWIVLAVIIYAVIMYVVLDPILNP